MADEAEEIVDPVMLELIELTNANNDAMAKLMFESRGRVDFDTMRFRLDVIVDSLFPEPEDRQQFELYFQRRMQEKLTRVAEEWEKGKLTVAQNMPQLDGLNRADRRRLNRKRRGMEN